MGPKRQGLTESKASELHKTLGPNKLPEKPPPTAFEILISQLKSPLVYILLFAGGMTVFLGDFADAVIIGFAVFINTILGFLQERRANNALASLKKMIHSQTMVIRDGERKRIDATKLVTDDVVVLVSGDKVPADGIIIESNKLLVNESMLTGESVAVIKKEDEKAFMGTSVVSGTAYMRVSLIGDKTEMGKIALSVQETFEDTPLRLQLKKFSTQLTYLVIILVVSVFSIGLLTGKELVEIFTTSVALSVSSIPEGLLVGLTVVLAVGMQRILKKKGLVRNLLSAETLGGVTTICTDKTGTLTNGQLKVVDTLGDRDALRLQAAIANDLDDPIVVSAFDWAKEKISPENLLKKHARVDAIPFSSQDRFFASLHVWDKSHTMLFVNGAPEYLLEWSDLTKEEKQNIQEELEKYAEKGMRVVGMARKKMPKSTKEITKKIVKKKLEWIGILVFSDPVRSSVKEALVKAREAGVRVIVITGDYAKTALSVMKNLDIHVSIEAVITGDQLSKLSERELSLRLKDKKNVLLFARTTPDQKLKIVEALKKNGEVVAMTGDGVNDAPALNRADIGIVVGDATDVAKESSDLVLLDSHFDTIVTAIEEGRSIFDNIRKIIMYLMSDAFEGIIAVLITLVLGLPLPILAAQILWINLISDGFPHLALTIDPKRSDIMKQPPRDPGESLVSGWMKRLILIVSLFGGITALIIFLYYYRSTGNLDLARSVTFAALGTNSSIYVYSVRTLISPFWKENPFVNKWLNIAVIASIVLQIMPFLFAPTRQFFRLVEINLLDWGVVFAAAFAMFIAIEISKFAFRRHLVGGYNS